MAETNVLSPVERPLRVLEALANPVRLQVVWLLAAEGPKSVSDLGARLDRAQHSMSKHLTVLWQAGIVVAVPAPDGDGRKQFFALPAGCLRKTEKRLEIDFGVCVLRAAN